MSCSRPRTVASVHEAGFGGRRDRPLEHPALSMACIMHEANWENLGHPRAPAPSETGMATLERLGQDQAHGGNESGSNSVGFGLTD